MGSILTNMSVMTALQALSATRRAAQPARSKAPTGVRLGGAENEAAYWSIAAAIRSDDGASSSAKGALNLDASPLGLACAAMNSIIHVMGEIKLLLAGVAEACADRRKAQARIAALQGQLQSIANSASFGGQNFLSTDSSAAGYNATKSVVASFSRDSTGSVSIGTIDIDQAKLKLFDATSAPANKGILDLIDATTGFSVYNLDISAMTNSDADLTRLARLAKQVEIAIQSITEAASMLLAIQSRINLQADFATSLSDPNAPAVTALADANPVETSTISRTSRTQRRLRNQSLSIANQHSELILKLFAG
jgi:flagellin